MEGGGRDGERRGEGGGEGGTGKGREGGGRRGVYPSSAEPIQVAIIGPLTALLASSVKFFTRSILLLFFAVVKIGQFLVPIKHISRAIPLTPWPFGE